MNPLKRYPNRELKLIYRLLHQQLSDNPGLLDSELMQDLQSCLQQQARQQGVDVSLHADWSAWLNDTAS